MTAAPALHWHDAAKPVGPLEHLRPYLAAIAPTGSTATEIAAVVHANSSLYARVQHVMVRLHNHGLVRKVQAPYRAVWHRTEAGDAWLRGAG